MRDGVEGEPSWRDVVIDAVFDLEPDAVNAPKLRIVIDTDRLNIDSSFFPFPFRRRVDPEFLPELVASLQDSIIRIDIKRLEPGVLPKRRPDRIFPFIHSPSRPMTTFVTTKSSR